MRFPDDIRNLLRTQEPTRPRLTWYGATPGERVELSGRVLDNWAAKVGNLLQEELDVGPGQVVQLDLPTGHWRAMYWALGAWSIGATVEVVLTVPTAGAEVIVSSHVQGSFDVGDNRPTVVAVNLETLARQASWPLSPGDIDEAQQLSSYGDVLQSWDRPTPGTTALRGPGGLWSFDALIGIAEHRSRMLLPATAPPGVMLRAALSVWAADGSVVLTSALPDEELRRLASIEGAQIGDPDTFALR